MTYETLMPSASLFLHNHYHPTCPNIHIVGFSMPDPESNLEDSGKITLSSYEDATYAYAISTMQN